MKGDLWLIQKNITAHPVETAAGPTGSGSCFPGSPSAPNAEPCISRTACARAAGSTRANWSSPSKRKRKRATQVRADSSSRMAENRIRIAVDAMGGDHAPAPIVAGAVEAARLWDYE